MIEWLSAVRQEGEHASNEERVQIGVRIVNLFTFPESDKVVESSDALGAIVGNLAGDLELANGDVDELWRDIAAAIDRFVAAYGDGDER